MGLKVKGINFKDYEINLYLKFGTTQKIPILRSVFIVATNKTAIDAGGGNIATKRFYIMFMY